MNVLETYEEFKKVKQNPEILVLAAAIVEVSKSIDSASHRLGTGNAATQMGALEALGVAIKESVEYFADSQSRCLENVSNSLDNLSGNSE